MVRHKNRYIAIEINEQGKSADSLLSLSRSALYSSILQKVQQLHGDFGTAAIRAGFAAKYCNEKTRIAIIRVRHGPHKLVSSSLPCINCIDNKRIYINTLYTGATIRQCFKFIQNHQQLKFDYFCSTLKSEEDKEAMRETLLNLDSVLAIN